jgi:Cytochrome C oxidase, cbb3-type, subunit III
MSPITRSLSVFAVLGIAACASSGGSEPAPAPAPATTASAAPAGGSPSGMFSASQASSGRDQFQSTCTNCHSASDFSDQGFKIKWSRRTVGDLYSFIHTNMPDDSPGILTDEQTVDLVSFILQENGFQPGNSMLAPDQSKLDAISLASLRD